MVCLRTTRSTLSNCTSFKSCVLASVASIFGVLFVLYFHLSAMVRVATFTLHLPHCFVSRQHCISQRVSLRRPAWALSLVSVSFSFSALYFSTAVSGRISVTQDTLTMLRHSRLYASKARLSSNGGCKMGCTYLSMRLQGLVDRESAEVAGGSWKAWLGSSLCIVEAVVPPHCGARRDMSNEFRICL